MSDVWKYNITSGDWQELPSMNDTVSRHCACTINDKIIIQSFSNTIVMENDILRAQPVIGDIPIGLSMCASATIGKYMLIFGGTNEETMISNSLYVLDTEESIPPDIPITKDSALLGI